MPAPIHTAGAVIRVRQEKNVTLTLLSPEEGKMTVIAKGAKSQKSGQMPLSQLFAYGDYELYRRGDLYWLNTGELRESFFHLTEHLDRLNLAVYFCDVACAVSAPGEEAKALLRLLLNALYALDRGTVPTELVKGVFEWRVLAAEGVVPLLTGCAQCGTAHDPCFRLDIGEGTLTCTACREKNGPADILPGENGERRETVLLTPGALEAIRFSVSTPLEKLFSFRLDSEDDRRAFTLAGEKFLRYHLETESAALKMYYLTK